MTESSLKLAAGTPPSSKEEYVYDTIKEGILSGALPPGETLVQTEIAETLRVSAIPVRAAINRLIAEGLVTQDNHRSPVVSGLSHAEIEEMLHIRMHLEELATREAMPRIGPAELRELTAVVDQMQVALAQNDMSRFGALNKAFHLKIYEYGPYPLLAQMIRDLWANTDRHRSRAMFSMVPGLAERSHKEHREMLRLLQAREYDRAAVLMEQHKTRSREQFIARLRASAAAGGDDAAVTR